MTYSQKFIVAAYRYLAIVFLLGILGSALGYFGLIALYGINNSWLAPIIVSQTNERILGLTAEMFRARQAADALDEAKAALGKESKALGEEASMLQGLIERSRLALSQQQVQDRRFAARLASLQLRKHELDTRAHGALAQKRVLWSSIEAELAAGLITKLDAERARVALSGAEAAAAHSLVATAALERQVSELNRSVSTLSGGPAESAQTLEVLARVAALESRRTEVMLTLAKNEAALANKQREAIELRKIIATLSDSPYYRVSVAAEPLSFAFVPYENEGAVEVGRPVYDCWAQVVFCRRAGIVKRLHRDEEKGRHPLFNRDIRGFLAELELDDAAAAKSRVLFIGRGPLFL